MKEYIAETGGRYTYSDDILNLQELSLSMTSIFEGCSNFVISGCEIFGAEITSGFVWINGKVRHYGGCKDATFPYYIYESNKNDTVVYANEVNKKGRCNYLCSGGQFVPEIPDAITGKVPQFIEVTASYTPRFLDKFIGRYAVLLDTPFARQTIKKDLVFAGKVTGESEILSKTAFSVVNEAKGYYLKNIVKADGKASVGAYLNGLLVNEIVLNTDGSFSFYKQSKEIARVSESGFEYTYSSATSSRIGSLSISAEDIYNTEVDSDEGAVNINRTGYNNSSSRFRNFHVYNGKQTPIFQVFGKTAGVWVNGTLTVNNPGGGVELCNTSYSRTAKKLLNTIRWTDVAKETIAYAGFNEENSFDFTLANHLGNVVISSKGHVNIIGELHIGGINIATTYVDQKTFLDELKKKVDGVSGRQLSEENFTKAHKEKLDGFVAENIGSQGNGFVTSKDATEQLGKKLDKAQNLKDVESVATARINLSVYSRAETDNTFLKVSGNLQELIALTAEQASSMSTEEIAALKEEKQEIVRRNIDAEKKGSAELRLAKKMNLSDLTDKVAARKNIAVYSIEEVDKLMAGKLSTDSGYTGVVFTTDHKQKLEAIKTGVFSGMDADGKSVSQVEGYALVSSVAKELSKKANLLLDGYTQDQKKAITKNIDVYSTEETKAKFAAVDSLFQDYITYLVKQGHTTAQAQQMLREKLSLLSKEEVVDTYLRKDARLTDLLISKNEEKKQLCRLLGAAYAEEYQPLLKDTGWIQMSESGSNTDARQLFIRQIGNIVCIQGIINTGKRDGSNKGGVVAIIPNSISPPKYGLRQSYTDYNDDHKHNRGSSFIIQANSRKILLYESGWYNVLTEIHFTYMT
ncbi:hypothetical protein [Bacteroides sp. 51]|uniref:hypothetical protein n=1 Tax=Bacteroides sp. 51 TaxID=2302938 RepID=UPI0013D14995|nr:hypothetical protein [Bacteroides sp. 51]NDV80848.1 hypothetical protein [Bacteroides sp. 51]